MMIQQLRLGKGDLVDLQFDEVNYLFFPKAVPTTADASALATTDVALNLWAIARAFLTSKWIGRHTRQSPISRTSNECTLKATDRDTGVPAGLLLRSVLNQILRLEIHSQATIVLSKSQLQSLFTPFSCSLSLANCGGSCDRVFDAVLPNTLALHFRQTFPQGLRRAGFWVRDSSSTAASLSVQGLAYTLSDTTFLSSLALASIRPRCNTSGRHFKEQSLSEQITDDDDYVLLTKVAPCENHIEDDHSDCASEASDEDLDENQATPAEAEAETTESSDDAEEGAAEEDAEEEDKEKPFVPTRTPTSPAELEWVRMKEKDQIENRAVDELMDMIGLEDVKEYFLKLIGKVNTAKRQEIDLSDERFGAVFLGNPGTGKTTVARLYAKFLAKIGLLPGSKFKEVSGVYLARQGVSNCKSYIEDVYCKGSGSRTGGTFFVDDAYQLIEHDGEKVLDYLLSEIENLKGKVAFVFAGYEKKMEQFFSYNIGMNSRVPHRMIFADFKQTELLELLQRNVVKRFKDKMKIEDGSDGLYMRVVSRRLHRRSGHQGFGNARDVENVFDRITLRQAERVEKARKDGKDFDDFFLTSEDVIGPEPTDALLNSKAYAELQRMIGLETVKQSLQDLVDQFQDNYKRELKELPVVEASLNRLFLGPPGTGKTTVASLYGRILADIGLLSSSEVVTRAANDLIGPYIGWSEMYTRQALDAAKGKVLVIDEAYMLAGSKGSCKEGPDSFRQGVIDTIVSLVQSTPGEDRAVLLLGYEDRMMDLLATNPGLTRRFPPESAFYFQDYDDDQLRAIMENKLEDQGICASAHAKDVAIDVLSKTRRRPNFGNAGEIENLLGRAKARFQRRISQIPRAERTGEVKLEPEDIDPDHDRIKDAVTNCRRLFSDVVGCEDVLNKLVGYIKTAENLEKMSLALEDYLPFNFIFKGPPGTGKTTTARKVGQVFYDMGLLGSSQVLECSVTDLIGKYVGQTGPKVIKKLDEALGKVLFIDEAYRLDGGGFAIEALDELVDSLTKPRYRGKLIVVLAGYEGEMNALLQANPGLSSRFSEEIMFKNLDQNSCIELLARKVEQLPGLKVPSLRAPSSPGSAPSSQARYRIQATMFELSLVKGWGNGRDIETLAKRIVGQALRSGCAGEDGIMVVSDTMILDEIKAFYAERQKRGGSKGVAVNSRKTYVTCG